MKVCSRCNIEKDDSEFRMRHDKRNGGSFYLNNTCKKCDAEITRLSYREWRKTPEGKKINRERAKAYYKRERDKVKRKMKQKRQTPEYKAKNREYRNRNKEKIHGQEIITKKRYHEKNKKQITDKYVKQQLRQDGNYNPTPEEIEIKRSKIIIHRIKEKIDSQKIGVAKICSVCKEEYDLSQFWRKARNSKKRVSFCKACGSVKNQEQKNKRNERHSKPAQSFV